MKMTFDAALFNDLISRYYSIRDANPYRAEEWVTNSEKAVECRNVLTRIGQLVETFVSAEGLLGGRDFVVKVAKGHGNFPVKPWIAILCRDEEVMNGVYPLIGFNDQEPFFYIGCAKSFHLQEDIDWNRYRDVRRCKLQSQRYDVVDVGLQNNENLAMPATVFRRGVFVTEDALKAALKSAIEVYDEIRGASEDGSVGADGTFSNGSKLLNSIEGRIKSLDRAVRQIEKAQDGISAKSGAGADAIEHLRADISAIKQGVNDARAEMEAGVAKAIKTAQEQTDVFLQQQKGAYTEALKNLSELKTLSTVGALTRKLEEKRKSEQRAMWGKAVPFYLSLLGFVVIGFLAMGLDRSFVTQEMLREHGMLAYLLPMPRVLIRLWPFCLPLIWCACHFGRLAAQGRRLMEEYAHKVVVAATYSGVAAEVDAMLEKHIMSAADLRVDLMRALINTIGSNPNYSLDKVRGTTPIAELTECVSKFSEATREVKGIGAVK